jgi:hypothetical protein
VRLWTGFIWLVMGSSGGWAVVNAEKNFGSIKAGEFLDYLSDYHLFKKDSAPWD